MLDARRQDATGRDHRAMCERFIGRAVVRRTDLAEELEAPGTIGE
jgi:hypothetical protein